MSILMKQFLAVAIVAAVLPCAVPTTILAAEWEEYSPYYEDDAWYDVSEWLDGNDYNPTDEVVGVWDDEVYDATKVESDTDNDWYGYDTNDESDNWYYDYYDDDYAYYDSDDNDGLYDYSYTYYDFDNDAYYDAYTSSYDSDSDGSFDRFSYVTFGNQKESNESANANQTETQKKAKSEAQASKQHAVTGNVEKTKTVKVRSGERLVAQVASDKGQTIAVDLGPKDQKDQSSQSGQASQPMVKEGQQITAHGPMIKVGDKQVLLAQKVKVDNGQEQKINRSGRQISGKIAKMKTIKVREMEHQMVILDLSDGKQILVDLGPNDKLQVQLAEGDQIAVQGVPVKVQDKAVIIANSVTKGNEKAQIERTARKDKTKASS